ncbi:MFS transporter [Streptomyces sp. TLI_171]|uniref:MFS transporter n=1 Tax=Streptomyces sp. TLI_171 TaxID=1938859 RepID=UPI000C503FF4|nr:MFS transporter [Streptomyces sp. TLI_171]RKE17143.1 EmrB/QacA subfamily drug resistance transporter [Streptomyces sp. TLI_171]
MTDAVTTTAAPPSGAAEPYRWRWVALFVILAAEVMDLLDSLVTNIAAPAIRADIGGGESTIQWLGAAYTLAMAIGLITGGRLGDIFGRRRMFMIGAAGFTIGSLFCGLAQEPWQLIVARVAQGLLGAVMLPQGLGIMKEIFSPKEQGAAFGMFGPVMGLSTVGGPILAGWLIDADFGGTGWRMIFLINIPLGLFAFVGGRVFLPAQAEGPTVRLDLVGALLAAVGAATVIYPLVQGREHDWPLWAFALLAVGVAIFGLFGWYEARRKATGADPLVEPSLFAKRGFSGGMVLGLIFFTAMTGFWLTFSLYTQLGLHYSALKSGLAGIPASVGMVIAFIASQALQKYGRKVMHAGLLVMVAGVLGLMYTLHSQGAAVTPWQTVPALAVTGLGMGLVMAPFFGMVLASVEAHETGSASGTLTSVQQLGAALGSAILGTVFFERLKTADFASAEQITLWTEVGLLVVVFAAIFLLPMHGRPEHEEGGEGGPVEAADAVAPAPRTAGEHQAV